VDVVLLHDMVDQANSYHTYKCKSSYTSNERETPAAEATGVIQARRGGGND